jgi:hypothetical protein
MSNAKPNPLTKEAVAAVRELRFARMRMQAIFAAAWQLSQSDFTSEVKTDHASAHINQTQTTL